MLKLLFSGQEALLVLLSAFIIGGIFKTRGLFIPAFVAFVDKVRSKRLALLGISLISGVLPVEGRVSVSAPILDSLVKTPRDSCCSAHASRGKMGVLDFVATHHYYLWSPLEKSVLIMMAGLSLTYSQLLAYTVWPLLAYVAYLVFVVFNYVQEDDIELSTVRKSYSALEVLQIVPFLAGLAASIFCEPYFIFPVVALFYVITNRVRAEELLSFIKWDTLLLVAGVIVLSNYLKMNSDAIQNFFKIAHMGTLTPGLIGVAVAGGFAASFALGSSGKYAGICVAMTLLFGIQYFPIILMAEYAGYLLSPVHKCGAISASYFKTRPADFYRYVGGLAGLMVFVGLFQAM
ncbi:hypothetical protein [Ralstonia phage RP31]|uniref:DUF401 family protein n=2 Tax=Ripduovirus RP12 TaxID=2560700 RepID=A0A1L7N0V7_9CAUD|nr:hypothetical protein FDH28_gp283 [Ralstonia phage RP12]BAW19112.1 hypothetical protein [Ralstonia phage RP12]BAW19398.1 hypothetical protein [Ralstonia phage RP31]